MAISHSIPFARFTPRKVNDFTQTVKGNRDALIYFLCNVGDADTQVLLLPQHGQLEHRLALIVDASSFRKAKAILDWATDNEILSPRYGPNPSTLGEERDIALVVATHPHADHIDGMAPLLERFSARIAEFWDPGYYHSIGSYHNMMREIAKSHLIRYANPSSGYRSWHGETAVTVLGPSVHLRNRFDSYGVDANDASLTLQVETPVPRAQMRDEQGNRVISGARNVLLLGGDAQTESWAQTMADFPMLRRSESPAAEFIGAAQGDRDLLRAGVHKVAHHGSKKGINLELAERIGAKLTLVSSVRSGGSHGFPHELTRHVLREAIQPLARSRSVHDPDDDPARGMFYTGDHASDPLGNAEPLGTIAVVMRAGKRSMWRLGDTPGGRLPLSNAGNTVWELHGTP